MNFKKINLKPIHYAYIIFIIVFSIHLFFHFPEYPCWDGAAYLVNGEFFLGKVFLHDELRPPIISIIYGLVLEFTKNIYFLNIMDITLRGFSAVTVFYLGRKFLSDKYSAIASIFALINPIALAIPAFMSEFIGLTFLCLSLIAFINIDNKLNAKNKNVNNNTFILNYIYMFVFAICAFLTRYPLLIYCIILLGWIGFDWKRHIVKNKFKQLFIAATIAGTLLMFWLIWNKIIYSIL